MLVTQEPWPGLAQALGQLWELWPKALVPTRWCSQLKRTPMGRASGLLPAHERRWQAGLPGPPPQTCDR